MLSVYLNLNNRTFFWAKMGNFWVGCVGFKEFYVRSANSRGALTPWMSTGHSVVRLSSFTVVSRISLIFPLHSPSAPGFPPCCNGCSMDAERMLNGSSMGSPSNILTLLVHNYNVLQRILIQSPNPTAKIQKIFHICKFTHFKKYNFCINSYKSLRMSKKSSTFALAKVNEKMTQWPNCK